MTNKKNVFYPGSLSRNISLILKGLFVGESSLEKRGTFHMGCKQRETIRVWDDSKNCISVVKSRVGRTHYARLCEAWSRMVQRSGRCVQRVKPRTHCHV